MSFSKPGCFIRYLRPSNKLPLLVPFDVLSATHKAEVLLKQETEDSLGINTQSSISDKLSHPCQVLLIARNKD